MSAFMIDNENLTRIAKYITAILNDQRTMRLCEGIGCYEFSKEDIERFKTLDGACDAEGWFNEEGIHRAVYELNKAALVGRYGECNDDYEPIDKTITITYQGYSCSLCSSFQYSPAIQMIPDMDYKPCVDYDRFTINLPMTTPLSAIVEFVRQMPAVNCADDYCSKIWSLFMWEQNEE